MSFVSLLLSAVLSQFNDSEAEIVGASEDVVESPEEAMKILERKSVCHLSSLLSLPSVDGTE